MGESLIDFVILSLSLLKSHSDKACFICGGSSFISIDEDILLFSFILLWYLPSLFASVRTQSFKLPNFLSLVVLRFWHVCRYLCILYQIWASYFHFD